MAGQYAFAPKDDDAIIRHRLLTRVSVTRGEPPMRRLVKKLMALAAEASKDDGEASRADGLEDDANKEEEEEGGEGEGRAQGDEGSGPKTEAGGDSQDKGEAGKSVEKRMAECEKAAKSFLLELAALELPLLKTRAVVSASRRDKRRFEELQGEAAQQIEQAKDEIAALKVQLEEAREYRRQEEECELVRHQIAQHPPRAESMAAIAALQQDIEALERESAAATRVLDLRRKQFALLLHTIDELQQVLDESPGLDNLGSTTVAGRQASARRASADLGRSATPEPQPAPMQVD